MLALLESPEYRVWDALDEDRSRTATMLHDGVAQPLAALSLLARGLGEATRGADPATRQQSHALAEGIEACASQMRTLARVLEPRRLVTLGLRAALAEFVRCLPARDRRRVRLAGDDRPVVLACDAGIHSFAIGCDLLRVALENSPGDVEVGVSRDHEGARLRVQAGPGAFPLLYELPVETQARSLAIGARLRLTAGRSCAELFLRERGTP